MPDVPDKKNRPSWDEYFMELAFVVSKRSTCLSRHVGSIVVKDKRIMTTGYNGAPSGIESCLERGFCIRREQGCNSGTNLEICRGSHAEENAIVQAAKFGICLSGGTVYCTHQPCLICSKMLINAGIKRVVFKGSYPHEMSLDMFREAGIDLFRFDGEIPGMEIEEVSKEEEARDCGCSS
jgi:dCMP deaminase